MNMKHDRNRNKTREARLGLNWCFGCDARQVGDGGKCSKCGRMNKRKRMKKPSPRYDPEYDSGSYLYSISELKK
jgi:hypothetical protein